MKFWIIRNHVFSMKSVAKCLPFVLLIALCSCSSSAGEAKKENTAATANDNRQLEAANDSSEVSVNDSSKVSERKITAEMAYEGVNNYCHSKYDWSVAEGEDKDSSSSSIMYVTMGEETESEYQVIFRSYTGAFVYFYVDKTSGSTKMVERVPSLDVENELGTINIFDYVKKAP